ncbi:hypothetical protein PV10_01494 [Exophiala mesophila]|uniref:Protein kinase domain-containing protein n=1 Tax=Exophiala mesophila TaxID=212818 RepID=A0A0D1YAX1_EXOME|nr:uncharacterized protein PV10_01494 [Exophiala mesophila]KIV97786.1 hypothetical protein PV10_01494 [Exophiala mesophila]
MANRTSKLGSGSLLQGKKAVYQICGLFSKNNQHVWPAFAMQSRQPVVIKQALPGQLQNEIEALRLCQGSPYVRQLIDTTESPPTMVLEHLDTSLFSASRHCQLDKTDLKQAIKASLHGLSLLHGFGRIHSDIKPDNILANRGAEGSSRFKDIKLCDLGDSIIQDASRGPQRFVTGTAVYRAPEVILQAPPTTSLDIWALGATALYFLVGDHLFAPKPHSRDDKMVNRKVLQCQMQCFGPFPDQFVDILPAESQAELQELYNSREFYPNRWPDALASVLDPEDEDFIRMLLKPDPRDRPAAAEALQHTWLTVLPFIYA